MGVRSGVVLDVEEAAGTCSRAGTARLLTWKTRSSKFRSWHGSSSEKASRKPGCGEAGFGFRVVSRVAT